MSTLGISTLVLENTRGNKIIFVELDESVSANATFGNESKILLKGKKAPKICSHQYMRADPD